MAVDKKGNEKIHARRRFDERYGITMTDAVHDVFVSQIQQNHNARFHCPQSNRVSIWVILIDKKYITGSKVDVEVPVVYDKVRKQLVSALPSCCLDVNQIGMMVL